jgi:hypothetical protein
MKMLSKSAILLATLAICLPARGEILIYKMTVKCMTASEYYDLWDVDEDIDRAYLVLDVRYDTNGVIAAVRSAEQIEYQRSGKNKWYWQRERLLHVEEIELEKGVLWVLMERDWGDEGAEILVLTGKARDMRIGLGKEEPRTVARAIKGQSQADYITDEGIVQMCTISLRLQSRWTKRANDAQEGNQDFTYAVYDIVKAYLNDNGYQDVT